jgi:hypothetical protein
MRWLAAAAHFEPEPADRGASVVAETETAARRAAHVTNPLAHSPPARLRSPGCGGLRAGLGVAAPAGLSA